MAKNFGKVVIEESYVEAFKLCESSLNSIKECRIIDADIRAGTIQAQTGISLKSFGEIINFDIFPLRSGLVEINITSEYSDQLIDWGKSRDNISAIFDYIYDNSKVISNYKLNLMNKKIQESVNTEFSESDEVKISDVSEALESKSSNKVQEELNSSTCKNCGEKVENNATFCPTCWNNIMEGKNTPQEYETDTEDIVPSKSKIIFNNIIASINNYIKYLSTNRKAAIRTLIGIIITFISILLIMNYNVKRDIDVFKQSFNSKKYSATERIYKSHKNNKKFNKEIDEYISMKLLETKMDYTHKKIPADEAYNILINLRKYEASKSEDVLKYIEKLKTSRDSFNSANYLLSENKFYDAMVCFYKVIDIDENYQVARAQIEKIIPDMKKEVFLLADQQYKDKDYQKAIDSLVAVLSYQKDDDEILNKIDIYVKEIILLADKQYRNKEYQKAIDLVEIALNYQKDDKELLNKKDLYSNDKEKARKAEEERKKLEEEKKRLEDEERKKLEELNSKKQAALNKVKAVTEPGDKIILLEKNLIKGEKEYFVFSRIKEPGVEGDMRFCVEVKTLDLYVYFSDGTLKEYDKYIKDSQKVIIDVSIEELNKSSMEYIGKNVRFTGTVLYIKENYGIGDMLLMNGMNYIHVFYTQDTNFNKGSTVTIVGIVQGETDDYMLNGNKIVIPTVRGENLAVY